MKEVIIKDFTHLEDAIDFLEMSLWDKVIETDEVDGEIKWINEQWRVGVTINGRQKEFNFSE